MGYSPPILDRALLLSDYNPSGWGSGYAPLFDGSLFQPVDLAAFVAAHAPTPDLVLTPYALLDGSRPFTGTVAAPSVTLTAVLATSTPLTLVPHAGQTAPLLVAGNFSLDATGNPVFGDAAAARTSLGLGSAATQASSAFLAASTPYASTAGSYADPAWVTSLSAAKLTGTIPTAALPPLSITNTSVVASQAAMLALTAQTGDVAVRTDTSRTYILAGGDPTALGDWTELLGAGEAPVQSVAGRIGTVVLTATDVGLGSVLNLAQEPAIAAGTTVQYWRGDKSWRTLNAAAIPDFALAVAAYAPTPDLSPYALLDGSRAFTGTVATPALNLNGVTRTTWPSSAGTAGQVQLSDGSGGFEVGSHSLTVDPTTGAVTSRNNTLDDGTGAASFTGISVGDGQLQFQLAEGIAFFGNYSNHTKNLYGFSQPGVGIFTIDHSTRNVVIGDTGFATYPDLLHVHGSLTTLNNTLDNGGGGATFGGRITSGLVAASGSGTYAIDASLGNEFRITLTGNVTVAAPTNPVDGQGIAVWLTQDATGGRTVTLDPVFVFPTDESVPGPSTAAHVSDLLTATYVAAGGVWRVTGFRKGYAS